MTSHRPYPSSASNSPSGSSTSRAALLAAAVTIAVAAGLWGSHSVHAAVARPTTAARMTVELQGKSVGFVRSVTGGTTVGEVVTGAAAVQTASTNPHSKFPEKHLERTRYEPIVVEFGAGMKREWWDAIANAIDGKLAGLDGAIVLIDASGTVRERLEFTRAWITEITFPTMDASSKEPAYFRVTLAPEETRVVPGGGKVYADTVRVKPMMASNFRLQIGDLGSATSKVTRIDSLTVKLPYQEKAVGANRNPERLSLPFEVSPLVITVPKSVAKPFVDWHNDFVVKRNNGQDKEPTGSLEWLAADRTTVLVVLEFFNVGIYRLAESKRPEAREVGRLEASMYCERVGVRPQVPSSATQ